MRVGKTRVSLDLVVEQYENGASPEDMIRAYDTLALADVHAVISYYLRNRDEVRGYMARRAEEAKALQAKIETERPRVSRDELTVAPRSCAYWPIAYYMPEEEIRDQIVIFLPFRQ